MDFLQEVRSFLRCERLAGRDRRAERWISMRYLTSGEYIRYTDADNSMLQEISGHECH